MENAFHPDKCNVLSFTQNKNPIKFNYTLHGHPLKCNVLSFTQNKNPIKFNYTLHGHPHKSLEEPTYFGSNNQTRFKMEKPRK